MHVLAFRHVPFEGAGLVEQALSARGIALQYADLYRPGAGLPSTADAAGLIFLGGPMSVNDPLPYLEQERQLIHEALGKRQPVLGICLGSQLLAQALGARVYPNRQKEIGWFEIEFAPAAAEDPLFGGLNRTETVFHWHGETFDLPGGAELLAWSEACRHQAFRTGRAIYGLQFHLEVTPAMIAEWCRQDENCGDVRELTAPIDPERHRERVAWMAERVFGSWADLL